jgi:hypothetical protein
MERWAAERLLVNGTSVHFIECSFEQRPRPGPIDSPLEAVRASILADEGQAPEA